MRSGSSGNGCYAIPGLIDLHFHGCKGFDLCDGTSDSIAEIAKYEASVGVMGICPATMTLPVDELIYILSAAASYRERAGRSNAREADLLGINMEGPFISAEKKGAQDARHIISCDTHTCRQFLDASRGLVAFMGVAERHRVPLFPSPTQTRITIRRWRLLARARIMSSICTTPCLPSHTGSQGLSAPWQTVRT